MMNRSASLLMLSMATACATAPAARSSVTVVSTPGAFERDLLIRALADQVSGKAAFDPRAIELAIELGDAPGAQADRVVGMAQRNLFRQLGLMDPIGGGIRAVDAPSVKTLRAQAETLMATSNACLAWPSTSLKRSSERIDAFVQATLTSPEGVFYAGQTEVDASGAPVIDRRIGSRENGWMIVALLDFYEAHRNPAVLARAELAATWIIEHRRTKEGTFTHFDPETGVSELADTLAMGEAALGLYEVGGSRRWLDVADAAATSIALGFDLGAPGYARAIDTDGVSDDPVADENAALARFAARLASISGKTAHRTLAEKALSAARRMGAPATGMILAEKALDLGGLQGAAPAFATLWR